MALPDDLVTALNDAWHSEIISLFAVAVQTAILEGELVALTRFRHAAETATRLRDALQHGTMDAS